MPANQKTLEDRISTLEREVQKLKSQPTATFDVSQQPWWEKQAGAFKNDTLFDDIVLEGNIYRQSLRQDEH